MLNSIYFDALCNDYCVGIMTQFQRYGTGVVLDGNSLKWQFTVQALKIIENEIPAGEPNKSYGPAGAPNKKCRHTHRSSEQKLRTLNFLTFMQRSVRTWKFL